VIDILMSIISLTETLKYAGVFIGTFVEGPIIGMITGFLIKLGYLNTYLSYLVYVVADLIADHLYYGIGYYGRTRFLKKFTVSLKSLNKAKNILYNHSNRIIVFGKLTHFLGLPILVGAGLAHYPWKKFLIFDLIATLIKSAILIFIGFYLTSIWISVDNTINYVGLISTFSITIALVYLILNRTIRGKNYEKTQNTNS